MNPLDIRQRLGAVEEDRPECSRAALVERHLEIVGREQERNRARQHDDVLGVLFRLPDALEISDGGGRDIRCRRREEWGGRPSTARTAAPRFRFWRVRLFQNGRARCARCRAGRRPRPRSSRRRGERRSGAVRFRRIAAAKPCSQPAALKRQSRAKRTNPTATARIGQRARRRATDLATIRRNAERSPNGEASASGLEQAENVGVAIWIRSGMRLR